MESNIQNQTVEVSERVVPLERTVLVSTIPVIKRKETWYSAILIFAFYFLTGSVKSFGGTVLGSAIIAVSAIISSIAIARIFKKSDIRTGSRKFISKLILGCIATWIVGYGITIVFLIFVVMLFFPR